MNPFELEEFRKAAERITREYCSSKERAFQALVELGIYLPDGNLNPDYDQ